MKVKQMFRYSSNSFTSCFQQQAFFVGLLIKVSKKGVEKRKSLFKFAAYKLCIARICRSKIMNVVSKTKFWRGTRLEVFLLGHVDLQKVPVFVLRIRMMNSLINPRIKAIFICRFLLNVSNIYSKHIFVHWSGRSAAIR